MLRDINEKVYSLSSVVADILLPMNPSFAAWKEFPAQLEKTLQTIGELSRHDRIHVVDIHPDMTYSIGYEWCTPKLAKTEDKLKHAKMFYDPGLERQLCEQNYIIIKDNTSSLNPDLHHFLVGVNCCQMLLLPLFEVGANLTFIAFMQCQDEHLWDSEEIKVLEGLAATIAIHLNNYRLLGRLLDRLRKIKKEQEATEILQTRLKGIHAAIGLDWEQLKHCKDNSETLMTSPEWQKIEQHLKALEKICRTIAVK